MSLTINHQTNDISNATGTILVNGVAVGGDNTPTPAVGNRAIVAGGTSSSNVIQYYNIASTGNAIDFGDLSTSKKNITVCSNITRALFAGGLTSTFLDDIEYVTIATTGNAQDFGDLTVGRWSGASFTDCHGGLGGF